MRFLLLALLVCLLALTAAGHKSVKEFKHQTEHEAMEHHHLHRQHRREGGVPHGDKLPRVKQHHEVLLDEHHEKHRHDGGHHRFSPHPRHAVGPKYSDHVHASHKAKPRYNNKGEVVPHEIRDETLHGLHHH